MEYYKLVAIQIDDFCSSITFESNYGLSDTDTISQKKAELESKGYVCLVAKTISNITV